MAISHMTNNDGYPWKEYKETNSPVKRSSDLDVLLKKYGQNKDLNFLQKNHIL